MHRKLHSFAVRAALACLAALAMALGAQAAEKKSITYSVKMGPVLSRTVAAPGDRSGHEIVQLVRQDMTSSSDPDWNDVPVMNYGHSDLVNGSGMVSGYAIRMHRNGDKTYYRYQGKIQAVGEGQTTGEGTVELIGGTGKFANAKGTGTWTSGKGVSTIKLDVDY